MFFFEVCSEKPPFNSTVNGKPITRPSRNVPIVAVSDAASQFTLDRIFGNSLRGQSKAFSFYSVVLRADKNVMHQHWAKIIPGLDMVKNGEGRTYYEMVVFAFCRGKFESVKVWCLIQYFSAGGLGNHLRVWVELGLILGWFWGLTGVISG